MLLKDICNQESSLDEKLLTSSDSLTDCQLSTLKQDELLKLLDEKT